MHKLPVVTLCLLAALTAMTAFICLSEAFAPRDTEYGSGKAVFKHYLIQYVQ
nr:hypothetical protein [uncultured Cupriavidus sp.]